MIWKLFLATTSLLLALSSAGSANCSNTNYFSHNYLDILASLSNREKDRVVSRISSLSKATPDAVYHRVYTLIKEDYYDGTYNHQDWSRWEHRYDGKLATFQDAHKAIETMLLSLGDRYTRFLDTDAFDDEKQQIESRLCGIGVQIGLDPDTHKVIVVAPIEDTPAYRAGVKSMDEMVRINGKSTKGFTVEDAAKHIRGQINTPVELVLGRNGKEIKVKVMRAEITILAVPTAVMLDNEMGYIRLSSFISQQATREMIKALDKLSSARGIILDLRDNPGGLLNNAIDISNLFIDKGNIVSTVDRDGYKTPASSDGLSSSASRPLARASSRASTSSTTAPVSTSPSPVTSRPTTPTSTKKASRPTCASTSPPATSSSTRAPGGPSARTTTSAPCLHMLMARMCSCIRLWRSYKNASCRTTISKKDNWLISPMM
ncbi:MAG: PDZ domain-containing protein [Candidatus Melainabacteria bacterium]|nr:PDZ domain-containing protein [Candidatus Melainabacteria bacterium]